MTRRRLAGRFRWTVAGVAGLAVLALKLWPHAPIQSRVPLSTAVFSADGELLRVTLANDDQYRLWVPLDKISPVLIDAVLLKEDRWFYWHPGVNVPALFRSIVRTYVKDDRQGGSTVTMQLARRLYGIRTRTPLGKLKQIVAACWLERRYSKNEILEAYLNLDPFGRNIEGIGAATLLYFGKTPDRVTLGEALTLAVIPQRPATRTGNPGPGIRDDDVLTARAKLGRDWLEYMSSTRDRESDRRQIELPVVAHQIVAMPFQAPHFVDALLRQPAPPQSSVDTTLDFRLQRLVETQTARYLSERADTGLRNAAAVVVDTRTMSVKAWIGSADYWNPRDGQVDGVLAKRSPGSTLKPFVYALALDQGVLHPATMLRDAPSAFGAFTPENFDGRFVGPITAQDALIRSRNVPAVWVSSQLKQPSLYDFLQNAGVRDLKPESFYGLSLVLGGGEVSMEELATLYAMLANGGELRPLRIGQAAAERSDDGPRLLSPEAAFITLDMLRHNPRPSDTGLPRARTEWPVAWKTGTSWGFRDAWSAGVAGPYVLVVWIGNFNGAGNPAFVGADAAAPLFFRIVDALAIAQPDQALPARVPPAGVRRVAVCAGSGDLPNADCPHTIDTWYIPGKSPIRVSQLHRRVAIDLQTNQPACPPFAAADVRFETYEFWPSDMLALYREAGVPRRQPPPLPACARVDSADAPRIASPLRNVTYALRSSPQDAITLDAAVAADVQRVYWFDGRSLLGSRFVTDAAIQWHPDAAGAHVIRVVDDHGRSAERDVMITLTTRR